MKEFHKLSGSRDKTFRVIQNGFHNLYLEKENIRQKTITETWSWIYRRIWSGIWLILFVKKKNMWSKSHLTVYFLSKLLIWISRSYSATFTAQFIETI